MRHCIMYIFRECTETLRFELKVLASQVSRVSMHLKLKKRTKQIKILLFSGNHIVRKYVSNM